MTFRVLSVILLAGAVACSATVWAQHERSSWHQATRSELASVLPSRAVVESEHIETEMRTASGIADEHGRSIAGVVLLTAGYSADGKYSHYLVVQAAVRVGSLLLQPGQYAFGWTRGEARDVLKVHFNQASNGRLVGMVEASRITESIRLESLHIWPPEGRSILQLGRFGIPYKLGPVHTTRRSGVSRANSDQTRRRTQA